MVVDVTVVMLVVVRGLLVDVIDWEFIERVKNNEKIMIR
jgi:hypothetical protein